MPEVICLGELLIDMVSTKADVPLAEAPGFHKAPGGAPANVAVGVAKLGVSSGFIGKVGDDPFGGFLEKVLRDNHVDTSHLAFAQDVRTTLVFVGVWSDGRKDMSFYRNPGADMFLGPEEVSEDYISRARVYHYGSISMIDDPSRKATLKAARIAKENGLIISYDPNLRLALWRRPDDARREIREGFKWATVAKVSEEEWEFITGTKNLEKGAEDILALGVKLVVVSCGGRGCYFHNGREHRHIPGFRVDVVETTGAGDGFMAGLIVGLLKELEKGGRVEDLKTSDLERILVRANAVGALATTKQGAIPALPTSQEVEDFLRAR